MIKREREHYSSRLGFILTTAACSTGLGNKWHWFKYASIIGNYLQMMFYTVISGWLLYYFIEMAKGRFQSLAFYEVEKVFFDLQSNPTAMILCTVIIIFTSFGICTIGLQGNT